MEESKKRGGKRPNAGRKPSVLRNIPLLVRIDKEAYDKISKVSNKSECINNLIKEYLE